MMADGEERGGGHRPAEAATVLGVPPSTLRLYSVRFAPLLSDAAARPVERGGGRPGFRLYSERDLAVLREGKVLLERGLTYEEALAELRRRWRPRAVGRIGGRVAPLPEASAVGEEGGEGPVAEGPAAPRAATPTVPSAADVEREKAWSALVANLLGTLASAQAVAEEWRRIVEERNAEMAVLRERLRQAEERARRPWWRRLLGD